MLAAWSKFLSRASTFNNTRFVLEVKLDASSISSGILSSSVSSSMVLSDCLRVAIFSVRVLLRQAMLSLT